MSGDELDVDAELLAMAGDDSSDDEGSDAGEIAEDSNHQPSTRDRTPSQEARPTVEKIEEPPSAKRGVAQKVKKRGGRKKVNKQELEDELDDLADSPSPANSPGSGAMSESGASSPAQGPLSPPDEGPLYPIEGKFMSASDRAEILALPEIERESILAERAQENLKRQQDLQLKKALAATQSQASKHKRKAAAADLDDGGLRKGSRPAKRSALDDYKKAREAKGADRSSRLDPRGGRRRSSRSPSSASDRDADGESEVEWADTTAASSRSRREDPPADLRDFERCRVGRSNFAKVLFYPNFDETMKGCFARVSIGMNHETRQNMYRMTQIRSFQTGKPYPLESGPNGKIFQCDLYALVAHGNAEKPWPLSACSDSRFSEAEYQRYIDTLTKERLRIPKKVYLEQKLDDINRFLNPQWSEEVLAAKFRKQREMAIRVDPDNAVKTKKDAILKRKAEAEENADEEELARCEAELAALENSSTSNTTNGSTTTTTINTKPQSKISPAKPTTMQEKLAQINQKNRGENANKVRRALLEERAEKERERKRAAAAKKAAMSELFGDSDGGTSRAGTPMSGVSTPRRRAGTPMAGQGVKERSKLGKKVSANKDAEDEFGGMDLGIDVEI